MNYSGKIHQLADEAYPPLPENDPVRLAALYANHADHPHVRKLLHAALGSILGQGDPLQTAKRFFQQVEMSRGMTREDAIKIVVEGAVHVRLIGEVQRAIEDIGLYEVRAPAEALFRRHGFSWDPEV